MTSPARWMTVICIALSLGVPIALAPPEHAQAPDWALHDAIADETKPGLCPTAYAIQSIVSVIFHALQAKDDGDQAKMTRLLEIASQYQTEICHTAAPDDVIFPRCRLGSRTSIGISIAQVKVSAIVRREIEKGEHTFYA